MVSIFDKVDKVSFRTCSMANGTLPKKRFFDWTQESRQIQYVLPPTGIPCVKWKCCSPGFLRKLLGSTGILRGIPCVKWSGSLCQVEMVPSSIPSKAIGETEILGGIPCVKWNGSLCQVKMLPSRIPSKLLENTVILAHRPGRWKVIQTASGKPSNAIEHIGIPHVPEFCRTIGFGVIGRRPFCFGLLLQSSLSVLASAILFVQGVVN